MISAGKRPLTNDLDRAATGTGQNSTFENQKGTQHQCLANYFQNNKLFDSNDIQSLKDKTESTRKEF
jgi:hypothetical protein